MEWCENGGVDRLIAQHKGKVPLPIAKPIILQTLEALAHAHAKGFVHRDLKPSNILIASAPGGISAKLADFGLAKSFEKAGMSGLTLTGKYAGTPYFIPREQIANFKYVKPVSDVWSMGATIYNMLTGQFPYEFPQGRDPINVLLNDDILPIRQRDGAIPKPLAQVIDRATNCNVKDRYPTAREMLDDLKQALP